MTKDQTTKFRDLAVGDTFDFISGTTHDSFYEPCTKTSARKYRALNSGMDCQVGSINAVVYHVTRKGA